MIKIRDREYRKLDLGLYKFSAIAFDNQLTELENIGKYCSSFYSVRKISTNNKLLDMVRFILKFIYFKVTFFILKPILFRQISVKESIYRNLLDVNKNQKKDYNNFLVFKTYIDKKIKDLNEILIEKNKEISELKLYIKLLKDELSQINNKSIYKKINVNKAS